LFGIIFLDAVKYNLNDLGKFYQESYMLMKYSHIPMPLNKLPSQAFGKPLHISQGLNNKII